MCIEGYIALARKLTGGANTSAARTKNPEEEAKKMRTKQKKPFERRKPVFGKILREASAECAPGLFVAKSPNKRYTGEFCGHWFENGEALVSAADAFRLELKGCEIMETGAQNDY